MQGRSKDKRILRNGSDIILLTLSYLAAVFLAKQHAGWPAGFLFLGTREWLLLLALLLVWNFGSRITGLYDELRIRSVSGEFRALGTSILLHFFLTVTVLFTAKSQFLSRFFVLAYFALLLASLCLWKAGLRQLLRLYYRNGRRFSRVLVVGGGGIVQRFCAAIAANSHLGLWVRGYVADEPAPNVVSEHLGAIRQLPQLLENEGIDEVVVALANGAMEQLEQVIEICERFPVRVRIIPDYFKFLSPRFSISRFGDFPILTIRTNPLEITHWRFCKRCFDLAFTGILFVALFSWLWPLLALLIKISSPGPVFFKQERWGIKNKRILCYKFRSMVKESRDVDEKGRYQQASRDDPRITKLGRFLRRSNLDELPQFINVFKGDMSIVGPRPHPTPMNLEIKDSVQHYQMRHLVKPGISGWAQVNGFRGETSDPEMLRQRVQADIWYIENWSFALDLKIVWLSLGAMCKRDPNAY